MGIAAALDIPLGMAAGAIVAAAYVSEIVSPLTDGPVLRAAIADISVFSLCKKFLPIALAVCAVSAGLYFFIGSILGTGMTEAGAGRVDELLSALEQSYAIGPVTLIPLVVMVVCIVMQVPRFRRSCWAYCSLSLRRCFCRAPTSARPWRRRIPAW